MASASECKPYPSYKQTNLDWYPEIPSHWNLRKVKHIASIRPSNVDKKRYEGQEEVKLANYVDVYYNDNITFELELMTATASSNEIEKFSLQEGDTIITKDSETWDDIAVPAFVPETMEGVVCGYHLTLIRPIKEYVEGEFLFRTYQAIGVQDQYHYNANGVTRYGLGSYWVNNGVVPIPPLDEQKRISDFLDFADSNIINLVSSLERLLELIQEKRSTLITQAVTKGLDQDVPMKDSGIDWIREIPVHWTIKRVKQIGKLKGGAGFPDREQGITGDEIPFHKVNALASASSQGLITKNTNTISRETSFRLGAHVFPKNTIVFAKVGAALLLKRFCLLSESSCIDNNMIGLMVEESNHNVDFMRHCLANISLEEIVNPGAVPSVNGSQIGEIPLPIPCVDEQNQISRYIKTIASEMDDSISKIHLKIRQLREYRTALISAAVTGAIDVRESI